MKTIFYQQNQLNISNKSLTGFDHVYHNPNSSELKFIINLFLNNLKFTALIVGEKSKIIKEIKKHFLHINAAGGLVLNQHNELLLIKRLGFWDLPKGKIEAGETTTLGAIREVEEECGISGLAIVKKLEPSYHIYFFENRWVLKTTHWFQMQYSGNEILIPQIEENITDVIWFNIKNYTESKMETYPAIERVLRQSLFPWE